jgi:succinate dehydrogenase / fumarate reductase cytochrome b subunit
LKIKLNRAYLVLFNFENKELGDMFNSTILAKYVVAITGLVITGFLFGHIAGNLLIFLGADAFNSYAHGLHKLPLVVWGTRIVLLICALLHTYATIKLTMYNKQAKPIGYKKSGYIKSTFASRNMIALGFVLLAFMVFHILHFTAGVIDPATYKDKFQVMLSSGELAMDAYKMAIIGFNKPAIVVFYVIAMFSLSFHLSHGIQSLIQTMGFYGETLTPRAKLISNLASYTLGLLFSSIPVSVLLGLIGKGVN